MQFYLNMVFMLLVLQPVLCYVHQPVLCLCPSAGVILCPSGNSSQFQVGSIFYDKEKRRRDFFEKMDGLQFTGKSATSH